MAAPESFPRSTYRLQITPTFTLDDAAQLCDYVAALGVDAVYLSPLLTSTPGSEHGYDWVDWRVVDPQRGGEAGWQRFVTAARAAGLKIVVDIVPNHMGIGTPRHNEAWWSVLQLGQASPYASWFDVDWNQGPITVPVLADAGALADLTLSQDRRELVYFEESFPVAPGTCSPGDSPTDVHERQHYRLCPWRDAGDQLNYRRFFAITTLAGLRVEDEAVALATHERILRWVREDHIEGLRIDHPDGLADPGGYLHWLRRQVGESTWIVVEKILEPGEELPGSWPVQGTTGYDAMAEVDALFIDPTGEPWLTRHFTEQSGDVRPFGDWATEGKIEMARQLYQPEIRRISRLLDVPADLRSELAAALTQLAAHFGVYRSYLPFGREHLDQAAADCLTAHPELERTILAIVPQLGDPAHAACVRFQQLTGAVMAKGVEDTAYYRYNRFIALNEVGGNPAQLGSGVAAFHRAQQRRLATQPWSMTALSTHDTKRSDDVRARRAVLSELPEPEWLAFVAPFADRVALDDHTVTTLIAQTLAGVGRIERSRLHDYVVKAMREAARHTRWTAPDAQFEVAVQAAIDVAFDDHTVSARWTRLLATLERPGWSNGLGRKLVQLTMPGVPDTFQGAERWEIALVDPDNRRPVDYLLRRTTAAETPPAVDATGAAKQWLLTRTLQARHTRRDAFRGYQPLAAEGPMAGHMMGFNRGAAITVVTLLPLTLHRAGGWATTTCALPAGTWTDQFTARQHAGTVLLCDLFADYPVALLIS